MNSLAQRVKGLLFAAFFLFAPPLWAATVVVDGACPRPGNGSEGYTATCDGTDAGNPTVTVSAGLAAMVAGDTLDIRGIHSLHESCPGSPSGRYFHTSDNQTTLDCSATSGCIMQNSGWAGVGTGERVYIEGGESLTWAQCTWDGGTGNCDCDAGHSNLTTLGDGSQAACQATWYVTTSDNHVIRPDGSPAFRIACTAGLSELDNSTTGYLRNRCSGTNDGWRACKTDVDCPSGQTCTSDAVTEVDSCEQGGVLFARLGASATPSSDGTKARPQGNGVGMVFKDGSKKWTVRGIIFKNHGRYQGVNIEGHFGASDANITLDGIAIFYTSGNANEGSDYALGIYSTTPVSLTNSEIAYSGSEGIHTEGACTTSACTASMPTVHTISNNVIRDQDNHTLLGNVNTGTPCNVIVGEKGGTSGPGDYTGTVYSGNIFLRAGTRGIILENNCSGAILRDNIFKQSASTCLRLAAKISGTHVDSHQIYNNLFIDCGTTTEGALQFTPSSGTTSSNKVYNNTFTDTLGRTALYNDPGTATGNEFRNNIFYASGSTQLINWTPAGVFQNNLVKSTTSGTLISFNGATKTCAQTVVSADVDNDGSGNDNNKCAAPGFVDAPNLDFHLKAVSPSRNAGTSTGMPSGRTADICNGVDAFYNDCEGQQGSAWDIGCDEY